MEQQPQRPPNYLAVAIITTILCCLPAGIVSIVYSTKVNTEYDSGNYNAAESASKSAKTWAIVSAAVAGLLYVIIIAIYGFAIFGMIASGNFG
ncbi:MAG: CD225/dispanin family protein [Roseivirga sp.]|nr:CD225/dispanin family protein [Roseivirga sp.]